MNDYLLDEFARISGALVEALAEVRSHVSRCAFGEPLREVLAFARDLVALADEALAADPQAGEHARGMALHMAAQLTALEALLEPIAGTYLPLLDMYRRQR